MSDPFRQAAQFQEISEVNVVPLADVSLVLLIILLLLSPMMTQSMLHVKTAARSADSSQAPQPPPQSPPPRELVLAVELTPQGLSVGGMQFPEAARFTAFMKTALSRRADRKVFLSPHPDVAHGRVVDALELIKSCGAESVALVQTMEEPNSDGQIPASATAP
ncbi:MAG: biopolymer transporter ExbD [Elusimicrobiota bacterium]